MSIVAPKGRKHLSADALFGLVRRSFANIADDRGDDAEIPFTDALMSAFAMFSLTSPALLAFDKQRVEGNLATIYGINRAPCDTYMRETTRSGLARVAPAVVQERLSATPAGQGA